jgi:hypothetical protein
MKDVVVYVCDARTFGTTAMIVAEVERLRAQGYTVVLSELKLDQQMQVSCDYAAELRNFQRSSTYDELKAAPSEPQKGWYQQHNRKPWQNRRRNRD